jgi:hypothetical protein
VESAPGVLPYCKTTERAQHGAMRIKDRPHSRHIDVATMQDQVHVQSGTLPGFCR